MSTLVSDIAISMLSPSSGRHGVPDQTPVQRRLAAILAGDVVGYSRLMGVDEVGTLRALKIIAENWPILPSRPTMGAS